MNTWVRHRPQPKGQGTRCTGTLTPCKTNTCARVSAVSSRRKGQKRTGQPVLADVRAEVTLGTRRGHGVVFPGGRWPGSPPAQTALAWEKSARSVFMAREPFCTYTRHASAVSILSYRCAPFPAWVPTRRESTVPKTLRPCVWGRAGSGDKRPLSTAVSPGREIQGHVSLSPFYVSAILLIKNIHYLRSF